MKLTMKDVPPEVLKVWAIQMSWEKFGIGVGSELYHECIETIKKYPEWFPEENKSLNNFKTNSHERNLA